MKFVSKTHVAINVVLKNGANVHVTFMELTGKGSVYYTDSPAIAEALRNHYKFGKLFKEEQEPVKAAKPAKPAKPAAEATGTGRNDGEGAKTENVKEFANNEDAKDYLAERYGISRSKMRTRAAIEEAAKSVNVTVKWTE